MMPKCACMAAVADADESQLLVKRRQGGSLTGPEESRCGGDDPAAVVLNAPVPGRWEAMDFVEGEWWLYQIAILSLR